MLRSRIIPTLLVQNGRLVKTRKFTDPIYLGDPINAVRIFNEKLADEIIVLDISATASGRGPNFKLVDAISHECRMPLTYGGGVRSIEQIQRLIDMGVEKVALSTVAIYESSIVRKASKTVGSQSIVCVLDVKKREVDGKVFYNAYTNNGTSWCDDDIFELIKRFEAEGAGEILINSIDDDGLMKGYDLNLASAIVRSINIPFTMLGGAGNLSDLKCLVDEIGLVGAAAGSCFVFKGPRNAVLINYPSLAERNDLSVRWN